MSSGTRPLKERLRKRRCGRRPRERKFSAVAFLVAGSLGVVLTPLLLVSWYEEELLPWLNESLPGAVPIARLVTKFGSYSAYGRVYCLVFVLAAVGFVALSRSLEGASWRHRLATAGMVVGLILCCLGCIADYWLKWMFVFKNTRPTLHFVLGAGYSLGLLLLLLASAAYGAAARWPRSPLVGTGWLMISSAPLGLALSLAHIPSGTLLVLNMGYIDIGRRLMQVDRGDDLLDH